MAAGDMITRDHQYEYNGLLIGSQTQYRTASWNGLFDLTNIINSDLAPKDRDGMIPGEDLLSSRTITGQINLLQNDQGLMYDDIEAFQTAFASRRSTELPFVYKLPGRDKRYVNCRTRKSSLPKDADLAYGLAVINMQMEASDPRHFDLTPQSRQVVIPATDSSATVSLNVGGNFYTEPIITIKDLAINPIITLESHTAIDPALDSTGKAVRLQYSNSVGDTTVVDTRRNYKTITYNGDNAYNIRRTDSQWFRLMPGVNQINIQRSNTATGSSCTVVFTWNNAYNY